MNERKAKDMRPATQLKSLPITSIRRSPYQPRKNFSQAALLELAGSIKNYGLLQPVSVRFVRDGVYELIAGERRFRACKLLGYTSIAAIVYYDRGETESAMLAMIDPVLGVAYLGIAILIMGVSFGISGTSQSARMVEESPEEYAGEAGSISVLGGEDIAMFDTPNKEGAWEFMKFMVSDFAQEEMAKVGQIPVNTTALESDTVKNADYAPFLEAITTAKARPPIACWSDFDSALTNAVTDIIVNGADAQSTLDALAADVDAMLAE